MAPNSKRNVHGVPPRRFPTIPPKIAGEVPFAPANAPELPIWELTVPACDHLAVSDWRPGDSQLSRREKTSREMQRLQAPNSSSAQSRAVATRTAVKAAVRRDG